MFGFANPFKRNKGATGMFTLWVYCIISLVDCVISVLSFGMIYSNMSISFMFWYTERDLKKRIKDVHS